MKHFIPSFLTRALYYQQVCRYGGSTIMASVLNPHFLKPFLAINVKSLGTSIYYSNELSYGNFSLDYFNIYPLLIYHTNYLLNHLMISYNSGACIPKLHQT